MRANSGEPSHIYYPRTKRGGRKGGALLSLISTLSEGKKRLLGGMFYPAHRGGGGGRGSTRAIRTLIGKKGIHPKEKEGGSLSPNTANADVSLPNVYKRKKAGESRGGVVFQLPIEEARQGFLSC